MKKFLLLTALFATTLLSSCFKSNDDVNDYPNFYAYVTAVESSTANYGMTFKLDSDDSFYVSDNRTYYTLSKFEDGDRFIAAVRLEDSNDTNYDFSAILYNLIGVKLGEFDTIETEEQNEEFADDPFMSIHSEITVKNGFMNLYVEYSSEKIEDSKAYLVENLATTPDETKVGYINMELRLDAANPDNKGTSHEGYLSFNMEEIRETIEGTDGIMLRVKGLDDEYAYVKIALDDPFGEEEDTEDEE